MPALLSREDQRISDRAVKAASEASSEERDRAHRRAREVAKSAAVRPFYFSAYLYWRFEREYMHEPGDGELHRTAATLRAIHERCLKAMAAQRDGGG